MENAFGDLPASGRVVVIEQILVSEILSRVGVQREVNLWLA
jgi:hypothetical protein